MLLLTTRKKTLNRFFKYSLVTLIFCGAIACKKKPDTTLGTDVQDEADALLTVVSDSSTIHMHTVKYDSIRSYNDQYKYLGSNEDPVFGRTNVGIFANFSLQGSVSNISFGEDAVLDSAEMILTFTQSFVGDSTTAMRYQVYQLTQSPDRTKTYYTHNTLPFNANVLSDVSRRVSKTNGFYTIRMPINNSFAAAILNNPQYLVNNAVFQNTYKGFYITTKNSILSPAKQGAIMKMDMDNPVSGVYLYYHNGSPAAGKEAKTYRLPFSSDNAARFNHVQYDPSSGGTSILNSYLIDQLDKSDTTKGKQNIFIKGLGGAKTVIRLPFLKNYADSCPISVNRAEMIFKVDQSFLSANNYVPPNQISMVACDAHGQEIYIKDQYYTTDVIRFGGTYDAANKWYVFNFARHVQDIMAGKIDNYGFYLVVADADRFSVARRDTKAERAIFGGVNNAMYAPRFKLTYIRFPYDK